MFNSSTSSDGRGCKTVRCEGIHFDASKAVKAQKKLREKLVISRSSVRPCTEASIVALDVAYRRNGGVEYAYGVALSYNASEGRVEGCLLATRRVCVPYIPGLLAFREMAVLGPLALIAVKRWAPDVFMVDGHGVSHPRGFGIASHIGVAVGVPSVGVAKKKLVGRIVDGYVELDGRRVARLVKTPSGSVIYVSPGHLVTLDDSYRIVVKHLKKPHKLPEPLRLADAATKASKKLVKPTEHLSIRECPGLGLLGLSKGSRTH